MKVHRDEHALEDWARPKIFECGGLMLKMVSPSTRGFPDDCVFWPGGIIHFLEFKDPEGDLNGLQPLIHRQLCAFGHTVRIPRSKLWIARYCERYADPEAFRGSALSRYRAQFSEEDEAS